MTVAVTAMQLENELKLVEDDLGSFIQSQRNNLLNEKLQLERNNPNHKTDYRKGNEFPSKTRKRDTHEIINDDVGDGLNLGGHEQKQRQLRNERHNEYKLYLEEQSKRRGKTTHFVDNNVNRSRNTEENRREYKSNIDKEYGKLLNNKKNEETLYNLHTGVEDVSSTIPHTGKKIIEFDDSDDELFNYVLREKEKAKKYHRSTSSDARKLKHNDEYDGRSSSVPPRTVPIIFPSNDNHESNGHTSGDIKAIHAPLVFGGPSHSDLRRERNIEHKKALEDQIKLKNGTKSSSHNHFANGKVPYVFGGSSHSMMRKEKELEYKEALEQQIKEKAAEKMKEKLKRMGKLKSDTDVTNNSELNKKDQIVQYSTQHVSVDKDTNVPSCHSNGQAEKTMFTHTNPNYPVTSMYNPMMNYPMGWPAYGPVMPNGFGPGNMVGFQQLPLNMQQIGTHGNSILMNGNDGYVPSAMDLPVNNRKHSASVQTRNSKSNGGNNKDTSVPVKSTKAQVPSPALLTNIGLSGMSDAAAKREQQKVYQEELKIQMEIKKAATEKEKKEREKYELKLEQEIATYDPWGKSGCGAPVRNKDGRVVADLKKVLQSTGGDVTSSVDVDALQDHPTEDLSPLLKALQMSENTKLVQVVDNSNIKPDDDSSPYARGAALKELQGMALSPRDKLEQSSYKQFLQQQVEEKKRKDEELKEKARLEEEKENKRLIEQQQRMHEEYEQEKERQRKKAEDVRQQNEALSRIAEQKKLEEELKRKQIEEERDAERRNEATRKLMSDRPDVPLKSNSPPVPAITKTKKKSIEKGMSNVRNDVNKNEGNENNINRNTSNTNNDNINNETMEYLNIIRDSLKHRRESEGKEENIQEQKDLIHQLSTLRKQLMRQEIKVQNDLHKNKKKYNNLVSDWDEQEKPPRSNAFDRAARITSGKKRIPMASPSQYEGISYENVNGYKSAQVDLDTQQQEYMKQQEKRLAELRQGLQSKTQSLPVDFKMNRQASKQSLLESDSKFISVENHQEVKTFPKRYTRNGLSKTNGTMNNVDMNEDKSLRRPEKDPVDTASLTTLQVQDIARKNDERLANLKVQDIAQKTKGRLSNLEEQDNSEDYIMQGSRQNQQYDIP